MRLSSSSLIRLMQFFERIENETYPETPMSMHTEITKMAIERLNELCTLKPGVKILDVGCGQGPALEHFRQSGADAIGITLNQTDVQVCHTKGFEVYQMDQSFLEFEAETFDIVWARHVVEHSVIPLFTLNEFHRVLKPYGILYMEVPGADTDAMQCQNKNHYSVFSKSSWFSLLQKSGFESVDGKEYLMKLIDNMGEDAYWGFYCYKKME